MQSAGGSDSSLGKAAGLSAPCMVATKVRVGLQSVLLTLRAA